MLHSYSLQRMISRPSPILIPPLVPVVSVSTSTIPVSLQSDATVMRVRPAGQLQSHGSKPKQAFGKERSGHRNRLGVEGDDHAGDLGDPLHAKHGPGN